MPDEPRTQALTPLSPLEESRTEALRPLGRLEESRTEALRPQWGMPAGNRPAVADAPPTLTPGVPPDGEPVPAGGSRRRMWLGLAAAALILIVIAAGLVVTRPAGLLGGAPAQSTPAGQPPTPLGSVPPPVLAAAGDGAPVPAADAVSAALRGALSNPYFGTHLAVEVADANTGQQLFAQHATDPTIPASTMKLATSTALLALRGPQYQLQTRVVEGSEPGSVVIIGGGDPSLAIGRTATYAGAARLDDLAAQVKRALGGATPTKVIYDSSLFSGPDAGPGWEPSDVDAGGQSARITALMTDGGRIDPLGGPEAARYTRPDLAAAQSFARLLGVPVSAVAPGTAPSGPTEQPGAAAGQSGPPAPGTQLGVVKSPPVVSLIEQALANSDNTIAETMARQVALALGKPASFAGGAAAVTQELTTLGLPMGGVHIVDGSGLSHQNTLTPALLTGVLALAARPDQPRLHGLYTGLPVAGYSGTLEKRFASPVNNPADGDVRAKTGTLSGVSSLAGYVLDARGRLLVFAAMADRVTAGTPAAQAALDQVGTALAGIS